MGLIIPARPFESGSRNQLEATMTSKYALACAWDEDKQAYIAVVIDKPYDGMGTITVYTVDLHKTAGECQQWFEKMIREKPWEARN